MSNLLTDAQRIGFDKDGLAFPIRVLSSEEVDRYRAASDALETRLGGKPRTIEVRQMHLHFRWAYELATHQRILDAVEKLLGPDLLVWATELFAKHARDEFVSVGWHRDRPYMGFTGPVVTAWIALSQSSAANGCMRAVPRSSAPPNSGGRCANPATALTFEQHAIDVALQSGEMSLHDSEIVHGSGPNHSGEKRVGFVVRFITPETRPVDGRPGALLVRGHDRIGHLTPVEPPADADADQALVEMRGSAARHLEAVLGNLRRGAGSSATTGQKGNQ
jgi:non-heme Fe2+,alpha-ketoglutarate-dependent halogenase